MADPLGLLDEGAPQHQSSDPLGLLDTGSAQGEDQGDLLERAFPNVSLGFRRGAAFAEKVLGNMADVIDVASDKISDATGLQKGGAFRVASDYLRKRAAQIAPTEHELSEHGSFGGKLVQAFAETPWIVGTYMTGSALTGGSTIAGMGAVGVLENEDKGIKDMIKGGVKDALLGTVLEALRPMTRVARAVAAGSVGAGMTAAQGGDWQDDLVSLLTMGGLALPGGKGEVSPRDIIERFRKPGEQPTPGEAGKSGVHPPSSEETATASPPTPKFEGDTVDEQGNIRVSPARREEAVNRAFEEKQTAEEAGRDYAVVLTGGPPGGGKSTGLDALGVDKSAFVRADADEVKEWLGYEEQAPAVHEESSAIAKEITDKALKDGYPLIYDSLLSNFKVADSIVQRALDRGGVAKIVFTDVDAVTSQVRSLARMARGETNRAIPLEASVKGYNNSLPTFLELWKRYKDNPDVDFVLRDNDTDGREPVTVFSKVDGEFKVLRQNFV